MVQLSTRLISIISLGIGVFIGISAKVVWDRIFKKVKEEEAFKDNSVMDDPGSCKESKTTDMNLYVYEAPCLSASNAASGPTAENPETVSVEAGGSGGSEALLPKSGTNYALIPSSAIGIELSPHLVDIDRSKVIQEIVDLYVKDPDNFIAENLTEDELEIVALTDPDEVTNVDSDILIDLQSECRDPFRKIVSNRRAIRLTYLKNRREEGRISKRNAQHHS